MFCYNKKDFLKNDEKIHIFKGKAQTIEKSHLHNFIEIVYIISGKAYQYVDEKKYTVSHGCLLFINYSMIHSFITDGELEYYNLIIDPSFLAENMVNSENAFELLSLSCFSEFCGAEKAGPFINFTLSECDVIENVLKLIYDEYMSSAPGYVNVLKAYTEALLIMIFRKMTQKNENSNKKTSTDIIEYIINHSSEKLSLADIAQKSFYNPSYLSRIFKKNFGMTLTQFILKERIEKSCNLLENTDIPINKIALMTGFSDVRRFHDIFKKKLLQTPGEYREKVKKLHT